MPEDHEEQSYYYLEELSADDGRKWQCILDDMLSRADSVEFIVPVKEQKWPSYVKPLLPFLEDRFTSHWRWQLRQNKPRQLLRLRVTHAVKMVLRTAPTLQDWLLKQDELPEDIVFYRDGVALAWTVSHEGWVYLLLTPSEVATWRERAFVLDETLRLDPLPPTRRDDV